jgi:NADPH-dependent curcumin reductase CurA
LDTDKRRRMCAQLVPATQSRITLQSRPKAAIDPSLSGSGTFKLEQNVAVPKAGDLDEGEILVQVEWLSLDPAMRCAVSLQRLLATWSSKTDAKDAFHRGWLNDTRSYIPPVKLGEVMRAGGVGKVLAVGKAGSGKKNADLKVGDWVYGTLGWQEVAKVKRSEVDKILQVL